MTVNTAKSTVSTDNDAIVSEIDILAPPERVFQALTDARQLGRWFTNTACPSKIWEMDARREGRYRYVSEKGSHVINGESEFRCHGEILECDPPRLLVYTWIANWHDDKSLKTIVRWELSPQSGGTLVKVTHSGLASENIARKDYSGGWPGVLEQLKRFTQTN